MNQRIGFIRKWWKSAFMSLLVSVVVVIAVNTYIEYEGDDRDMKAVTESEEVYTGLSIKEIAKYIEFAEMIKEPVIVPETFIYELRVDDSLVYYCDSIEEIEAALGFVVMESTKYCLESEVEVAEDDFSLSVAFELHPELSAVTDDRVFRTSSLSGTEENDVTTKQVPGPMSGDEGSLLSLNFYEDITISQVESDQRRLSTGREIADDLLKLNVIPDAYEVQPGDSPYTIAGKYEMSLEELFSLNDGLEERAQSVQIGEELIVEKLVPELSLVIESEVTYVEVIGKPTVYEEDPEVYNGRKVIGEEGADGVMGITATVTTVNGDEIRREVASEEVILPPEPEVILVGTKPIPDKGPTGFFVSPLDSYRLSSSYGPRWGRSHNGIDMAVNTGTSVLAADGGTVIYSGWNGGYGYMIDIDNGNGVVTRYAHNSKLLVSVGDIVGQGERIAQSGNTGYSTGPHLHFEIRIDGVAVNPYNHF